MSNIYHSPSSGDNGKKCGRCGERVILHEPDPCLGYLPGIAHACCGHGVSARAYCVGWNDCQPDDPVVNSDRPTYGYFDYRGKEALDYMKSPPEK